MSPKHQISLIFIYIIIHLTQAADQDDALDMTVSPSNVVKPASSVAVTCTVNYSLLGSRDVIWQMRRGSMVVRFGYHATLEQTFTVDGGRYSLTRKSQGLREVHTLKISDVQYEDSSTIECVFPTSKGSKRKSSVVLAVCDDFGSVSCKCMNEDEGWASPQCFKEPADWVAKNKGYKNAVVVLAVFLAIAIAIGVLMAVLAGKDCMAHALAKQQKMADRRSTAGRTNSIMIRPKSRYDDSQQLTQDPNESVSEINVESEQFTERPRQRGRRSERGEKQGMHPRHLVEDEQSDSGMSSANASTQGAGQHAPHMHQDSNSSTSSQQAVRPKGQPSQKNLYAAHEDLSSGFATPYEHAVSPRSVQSEGDVVYSPGPEGPQPPPRAAHTDVSRSKARGSEARAYFANPKRLDFQGNGDANGHVANVHRDHEAGAYVSQNSTAI